MENTPILALWVIPTLVVLCFVGYIFARSYTTEVITLPKISPKKSRPRWLNQIKAAKQEILIVAGDLSKEVYNDTEVVNTFKRKIDDGVQIKVIFGPALSVDENGRNAFLDLFKLPNKNILYSKERQRFHFRIIDGKSVYFEKPHDINGPIRDVTIVNNSIMWSSRLTKLFNKIIVEEEHLEPYNPEKNKTLETTET